jgi:hypothetical protein
MRIAFLLIGNVGRSGPINGYNIRYGGSACSGTESSVIYVAEYLSKIGHDVTISLEKCDTPNESNGVFYTDLNFNDVTNKEYDVLVSALWFVDYGKLPIKVNQSLIYWYHLAWGYGFREMIDYVKSNNLKLGLVSISEWAKKENDNHLSIFINEGLIPNDVIIPNPLDVTLIDEVLNNPPERKNHKVIFHAQWSRGGDVAKDASHRMGWSDLEFKSFDYVNFHNGIDKKTLFNEIASSEYFIFPILTHGKLMYQDTFSLSVAEAISLGTTVLTYPLGAIPENFGDYCHYIEYPDGVDIEKLSKHRVFEEPRFSETDNIVKLMNQLEINPQIKKEKSQRGIDYIKNTFDINKVGPMWVEFLNKL